MTLPRSTRAILRLNLLLLLLSFSLLGMTRPLKKPESPKLLISAAEPEAQLHLQWVREYPPLKPAWPDQPKLQFDAAYQPVVYGRTVFLACSRTDSVTAIDTASGEEKWRFCTDGPVRFAPVVWQDRLFFVSDDGYLYCVEAERGRLLWKFRGGPSERMVLGNERLISTWPVRGAPVVADDTVYFAAGIWPFMGIFIHAVDARTGEVVWTNDGDGSRFMEQPHHADSFGGVAPQGRLVVTGDRLLVPGGRTVPACYDRRTGKQLYYHLADYNRSGGGPHVAAHGPVFVNGDGVFDAQTGHFLADAGYHPILTEDALYSTSGVECRAYDWRSVVSQTSETNENRGRRYSWTSAKLTELGSVRVPVSISVLSIEDKDKRGGIEALTKDGSRLYVGAVHQVFAIDLPMQSGRTTPTLQARFSGRPVHLAAGDGRLFVATREGRLYCFGPERPQPRHYPLVGVPALAGKASPHPAEAGTPTGVWSEKARQVLQATEARDGYCIAWGIGTGRLIVELARQSRLHFIVVDPDPDRVAAFRAELIAAGIYGERVAVVCKAWNQVTLPPYLARLMVAEDLPAPLDGQFLPMAFACLRPYGGVACLPIPQHRRAVQQWAAADRSLAQAQVKEAGPWLLLSRMGALPGAANWTHEHADAANTRVSLDQMVKAPLGLLWFGGPSHQGILPRHGHGPQPQVIDGRIIIEGADMLRALDLYTGRLLWEARMAGVGKAFDSTYHQAGANGSGTNYISTSDGIYVAYGSVCVRLDPATGKRLAAFPLPILPGERERPAWGYINVCDDYLVGGANPTSSESRERNGGAASSKRLVVLNRHNGKVLWTAGAETGFRHNAICLGGGRLYAIDRPTSEQYYWLRRNGDAPEAKPRLIAYDLRSGKEVWSSREEVFGTWLSYSAGHDVLVEAGREARDTLYDEARGMRAYRADRGAVLWYQPSYSGPAMIRGDTILKDLSACNLLTGVPTQCRDPLTGQMMEWTWTRDYGCNTPAASQHMLTFRSGAAGFYDLANDGGTGNLGGFRSGCTNNLIVAGGVLCAPEYTRTCTCSYQNQASLALVHAPEAELWTYFGRRYLTGPIRRAGINLGAPGNRKADDGTLWLEFPSVGGPSPRLSVTVAPSDVQWFCRHSSRVEGALNWVAASGVKGVSVVTVTLGEEADRARAYTVRLHFVEPDGLPAGQRVFDVAVQGQPLLKELDISKQAGGPWRALVKEFNGIKVTKDLTVALTPAEGTKVRVPVLCGIEVLAEGW